MKKRRFLALIGLVALFGLTSPAVAENSSAIPGYTVHHNAFTTDVLTPYIARRFHVQRSKNRGMLNVSVIKNENIGVGKSVEAKVTVTATNLTGQLSNISMREVREGTSVYYIGDFKVNHQETLKFDIKVQPRGESKTYDTTMTQEFYTR